MSRLEKALGALVRDLDREIASDEETARAGSAARLIEARGFARGRDLTRAVAEWRDSAGG
jgi:hypothetical protein